MNNDTRQSTLDALFVGYEDQENLGLRSIVAFSRQAGLRARLVPYRPGDTHSILRAIENFDPALVGFSIIFQYSLDQFIDLTAILRQAGVKAHFTVGGHFPTLKPREVLAAMPDVDTVVKHEGEETAVELIRAVEQPAAWPGILGLVHRNGGHIAENPARPLISDLDSLPLPVRDEPRELTSGVRVASILASRGCLFNCTFCSIRQFYGGAPGPLRRTRTPAHVVDEMQLLHDRDGINLFIFQDDDFAARSPRQRRWLDEFLDCLDASELMGRVRWKISCRVDDVDAELMERCRQRGLIAVYLGVESGTDEGLRTLNKRVTAAQNRSAVETLKSLGLTFDMGFMLFEPDSTIARVRGNISFLREVTEDGYCPVNFCKMLPYAGTPIEARLISESRLKGTLSQPDYDFLDPRLDWYSLMVAKAFRFRNFDSLGLVERLRCASFDSVLDQAFGLRPEGASYRTAVRRIMAAVNRSTLDALDRMLDFVTERSVGEIAADWNLLSYIVASQWEAEREYQRELDALLGRHSPELLRQYADMFAQRFSDPAECERFPAVEATPLSSA